MAALALDGDPPMADGEAALHLRHQRHCLANHGGAIAVAREVDRHWRRFERMGQRVTI